MRKIRHVAKWIGERPYRVTKWYVLKRVKSRNFTIISNNCWAGKVYQYFGMPYLSPTVGLYFFADDYLKFIMDLHHYLGTEMQFIPACESRYARELEKRKQLHVPVGVLDDIEVIFLHYSSEQEAKEKWHRRTERINWNNMFIKFSRMNFCTDEHIKRFASIPFSNKFVFNIIPQAEYSCEYHWKGPQNEYEILSDTNPFPGNISLKRLLQVKRERYQEQGLKRER